MIKSINSNVLTNIPATVQAYVNNSFKSLDLRAELLNKWSVLFFYPADFTFVCPTELEDLAGYYEELKSIGVEVYSVSTDTHFTHKAWHDSSDTIKKIKFPMLADPSLKLSTHFGVLNEEEGLAERATFVIDPLGQVKVVELTSGGVGRSAEELVRRIKAAQYVEKHPNEVCPAKWTPGSETLAPSLDLVGKI